MNGYAWMFMNHMDGYGCIGVDTDGYGYVQLWMDMDGRRQMRFRKTTKKKAQRPPRDVELSFLYSENAFGDG